MKPTNGMFDVRGSIFDVIMISRRGLFTVSGLLLSLLLIGCAAPGSARTRPSVRGRLVDARGQGIPNRRLDLMLPSQYGLSGLDAVWGKPEDYGHKQQVATVQTDSDGRFSHVFPATTYSITFYILPPIGAIPRQPPKPFFALRTSSIQPDSYLIGANRDHLDYRIWDHNDGKLRPDVTQKITGTFTLQEVPARADGQEQLKGWEADITVKQP